MDLIDILFYASIGGGFFMAFALGANDVANSMASAVGSRAITIRQAVFIAAVLNFTGALLLGSHVTATISEGIINQQVITDDNTMALGMFATLLSAAFFVLLSTFFSLPVSSTHAVIGALIGFGLVTGGVPAVQWSTLIHVVLSWVLTPFIALCIAATLVKLIKKHMQVPGQSIGLTRKWGPVVITLTVGVVATALVTGKVTHIEILDHGIEQALAVIAIMTIVYFSARTLISEEPRQIDDEHAYVESFFRKMQVFTSSFVAFAHGANDVANALGPVAAIYVLSTHYQAGGEAIPAFVLVLGGAGIALGIGLLGHRVIRTLGEQITPLDNVKGFSANLSVATTVMVSSNLGLPVSSSHVAVGAITGVGLTDGRDNVQFRLLGTIFINWIITLPIAAVVCAAIFLGLKTVLV